MNSNIRLLASKLQALLMVPPVLPAMVAIAAMMLASTVVQAQADFEKGFQAYQSYHGSDFDSVNLANGNLVLNIPLLSYEQRGGLPPVVISIRSNSTTFQSEPPFENGPQDTKQHEVASGVIGAPWGQPHVAIGPGGLYWKEERIVTSPNGGPGGGPEYLTRFVATDESGATHSLGGAIANKVQGLVPGIMYSVDGSGLMLRPASGNNGPLLVDRKGNIGGLIDPNGNVIQLQGPCVKPAGGGDFFNPSLAAWEGNAYGTASATQIVDSVGRIIPNPSYLPPTAQYSCLVDLDASYHAQTPDSQDCGVGQSGQTQFGDTVYFPGQKGGKVKLIFCYDYIPVNVCIPTVSGGSCTSQNGAINENWWVLTSVQLPTPTPTYWKFHYDSFGQVQTVTMPTGATVTYAYATREACGNPPGQIPPTGIPVSPYSNLMSTRMVTSRTLNLNDGSQPKVWSYASTLGSGWAGSPDAGTVTVQDPDYYLGLPDGNVTVHTFKLQNISPSIQSTCGPYETLTQSYNTSGTLLKTVATTYSNTGTDYANPTNFSNYIAVGVFPQQVTATLGPITRRDNYIYDSIYGAQNSTYGTYEDYIGNTHPFSYGQLLSLTESDWGSAGNPGPVLRTTLHTKLWQSTWNYYAVNLIDLPCLDTVFSGNYTGSQSSCTAPGAPPAQMSQSAYAYDQSPSPSGALGNLTAVTRWLNTGASPVSSTVYNSYGMPIKKIDPLTNPTLIGYDSTYLYPNKITYPKTGSVSHIELFTYDKNTGELLSHTDENSNPTTFAYDSMRRLTLTTYPADGGWEQFQYADTTPPSYVFTKLLNNSSSTYTETGLADTLGRKTQTQINSDPYGTIYADTQYDNLGRVATQSNPYRSKLDPTYGLTAFTYDALGRKAIQQQPDGNSQQWCYTGQQTNGQTNCNAQKSTGASSWVDFQDESGNDWQRTSDGLGRLTSVMEPNGTTATPTMPTSYTYDALGNLLTVAQTGYGTDTPRAARNFNYDSLSRLVCASNPENSYAACPASVSTTYTPGTTGYAYDLDNNLLTRSEPLVNATTGTQAFNYCYDALNRKTAEYTGSPILNCTPSQIAATNLLAAYTYDASSISGVSNPIGQLTDEIQYTAGVSVWERSPYKYDTMERLKQEQQCAFGSCAALYPFTYGYDYAGNVLSTTNGLTSTPITIGYTYDGAARLSSVTAATPTGAPWTGTGFPSTLYTANEYGPAGVLSASYGSSGATPMDLGRAYDNRLRITNNIVYSSSTPLPSAKVTLACITSGCPSFSGSVSVTVGGVSTPLVTGTTLSALATNLVSAINSTDGMTATATSAPSGTKYVVTLTSLIYGADGEASLSASVSSGATFTATTSSAKLTGDKDTIAYSYALAYAPNGNVSTVSDTIIGNWTYAYDTLNRLTRAQATTAGVVTPSGTFKTQCWTYDSFGNRTGEGEVVAKTTCPSPLSKAPRSSWTTYTVSNRVTQTTAPGVTATYVYDGAGNVLNDGVNQYVYDFEGRICAVRNVANGSVMTQYVYDAEGRRVAKGTISTWPAAGQTCAAPTAANGFSLAGTGAALYLRGLHGDQDTELDGTGNWRHTNVFAAGGLTVTYDAGATPSTAPTFNFNFADWLGTKRLQASNAAVTLNSWASDPFGSYLVPQGTGTDATEHHFTGKERDTESGNDYFGARYYSSQMGRFMSPDWSTERRTDTVCEAGQSAES